MNREQIKEVLDMDDKMKSAINPKHYNTGDTDVIDFSFTHKLGFAEGNVVKYIDRHREKNGLEDLYKAKEYLDRLIKHIEENGYE